MRVPHPGTGVTILLAVSLGASARVADAPGATAAGSRAAADTIRIPPLPIPYIAPPSRPVATERGLEFRLVEAPATPGAVTPAIPDPAGEPLSAGAAATLLARLPPLPDTAPPAFRFPPASPPPPRTGATVVTDFAKDTAGAAPAPGIVADGALEVVRIVPAGETELAPSVTIAFNQPMVPLTTVAGTELRRPPATLTPEPPGRWSWLDTRTLRFEPAGRLPMATEYLVEVPAGTRSAAGHPLAETVRTRFATPAPRAVGAYPALDPDTARQRMQGRVYEGFGPLPPWSTTLQPIILVVFDQSIAAEAVLAATQLTADGRPTPLRLATAAEVAADTVIEVLSNGAQEGRWVALRPVAPLRRNADVRVVIGPGALSAEGARTAGAAQELRFRTYGPLDVVSHDCWGGDNCRPGAPWTIRFSNPLDTAASASPRLRIEPTVPNVVVRVVGAELHITGDARPNTRYRVSLDGGVADRFGQTLAGRRTLTFAVGPNEPMLALAGAPFVVLDPAGPPRVRLHSVGLRSISVRIHRVTPEQWPAYASALQRWREAGQFEPPGQLVASQLVEIADAEAFSETMIDVGAALQQGLGHAVVAIEPARGSPPLDPRRGRLASFAWVQATRIGVAAAVNGGDVVGWTTSLDTGEPLAGVELRLLPSGRRAVTTADGLAVLELSSSGAVALVASRGGDSALLPENEYGWGGGWQMRRGRAELRWLLLSDRGLYRPGETARIKGWVRELPSGRGADLRLARDVTTVAYRLRGPRGEELATGELRPGALGGFDTALELPEGLNLGHATVEVEPRGVPEALRQPAHLGLLVQEFRRPDYEVTLEADPGPHVIRDVVALELLAKYYGGGGLPRAPVEWRVTPEPATYAPPGWDRWSFGRTPLWWLRQAASGPPQTLSGTTDAAGSHRVRAELLDVDPPFSTALRVEAQVQDVSRQAGSGNATVLVHPAALNVGLRVQRAWIRPGDSLAVGVVVVDHSGRMVPGRRVELVRERVTWTWTPGRAAEEQVRDSTTVCDVVSAAEPSFCNVALGEPGMYRLRADVRDDNGRISRTEVTIWVPGGAAPPRPDPASFELTPDRAEYQPGDTARVIIGAPFFPAEGLLTVRRAGVVASERFRITGATHELRVPITEEHIAGAIVHVELVDTRRATRSASSETRLAVPPLPRRLDVTITPRDSVAAPGAETVVTVQVAGPDGRPAAGAEVALWMVDEAVLAVGGYTLPDPLAAFYPPRHGSEVRDHALRRWVTPWPRSEGPGTVAGTVLSHRAGAIVPGATVRLEDTGITAVTGSDGSFVLRGVAPGEYVLRIDAGDGNARRIRIVVPADGVHLGNVVLSPPGSAGAFFEGMREMRLAQVVVAAPPPPAAGGYLSAETRKARDALAQEVEVRTDFSALAVFEPSLRTDADGRVEARVRLPGNLTRYRVMAVAVSGARHFGTGEATVTARKELMARVAAPRFLNYGDQFELPVLVQNGTAERLDVAVAARATGLRFADVAARRVVLPPGERAEIRFSATALRAGTARVQAIAVSGNRTDAARVDVPVYTPATTEAFATYGVIDTGAPVVLPVSRPRGVISGFGGLELGITSTALHALTDAVLYLHTYPFACAEQLSSRIMAVAALRDVLAAFAAEQLPPRAELVAGTQRDIARLTGLQNYDGGWGFWYAGEPSNPFVSVHAAHALQRASSEGFDVSPAVLEQALQYLRRVDGSVTGWPLRERQSLNAYALYVRHRLNDATATAASRHMVNAPPDRVGGELPLEATAWLLGVLAPDPASRAEAAELRRRLLNRVTETAAGAAFAERYDDGAHLLLHSRRRTDAVVLDALIAADPASDLVPKLAQSLLAHRVRGHWSGTQENAWVLLALNRYFRTYEAETPNFQSRVWLDRRFAGGHAFTGRTTERQHLAIPMTELLRSDTAALLIVRQGAGRMYYRAGLRYAPADLRADPLDRGFTVTRVYQAVDDTADVRRDPDGTWRVRAGARVRVQVVMTAPSARTHVALADPLPAGFEPLNPELRGSGFTDDPRPAPDPRARRLQQPARSWWFVHQNLRDDRAEAFATLLPAGLYEYSYLARATTPGTFVVPPPHAEMMYEPETFGRGTGDTVLIEVPQAAR
jgi:alpha-2-macroglobulin